MRRTSSISVSGVQVSGWSSITVRTTVAPTLPPLPTTAWITSRKVSMPTRSPCSITTSEPMSRSAIVRTASASGCSGTTVYRVPPLTRRMSLTFISFSSGRLRTNIAHNDLQPLDEGDPMPGYADPGFDTLALHAGAAPDPSTGARVTPLHLSTSFVFQDSDHAAALFNMERAGHVYSRISNPTTAVFEERMAALEGGAGAIATASGQAALHLAVATL